MGKSIRTRSTEISIAQQNCYLGTPYLIPKTKALGKNARLVRSLLSLLVWAKCSAVPPAVKGRELSRAAGSGIGSVRRIVEASPIISFPKHVTTIAYGKALMLSTFFLVRDLLIADCGFVVQSDPCGPVISTPFGSGRDDRAIAAIRITLHARRLTKFARISSNSCSALEVNPLCLENLFYCFGGRDLRDSS